MATDAVLSDRVTSALDSTPQPVSVLQAHFGSTSDQDAGQPDVERIMAEAGDRARGIVLGSRGTDVGHVSNVVNQGGAVRSLDGQVGGPASYAARVHDFASPGWEQQEELADFEMWLHLAVSDLVAFE